MTLNRKQKFLLVVFASIAIGAGVAWIYSFLSVPKPITRYVFFGTELQFRDDLRIAQNISVHPDEKSILYKVWDPQITKVKIAYIPTQEPSDENSLLALNIFEIRFKLDVAYRNPNFNWINEFTSIELSSFDDINQTNDTLVIVLVRPSLADKTVVEMDGNVIYIKGQTAEDLDKATIKFLMSALNITV